MQFIRPRQVLEIIGVSRTTLWRMVQAGIFPRPLGITERNRGYVLEAVEAWMKARTDGSLLDGAAGETDGRRGKGRTASALMHAKVLHPMVLCDLLIRLAQRVLYRARWSREILEGVFASMSTRRADLSVALLHQRTAAMQAALQDAAVEA